MDVGPAGLAAGRDGTMPAQPGWLLAGISDASPAGLAAGRDGTMPAQPGWLLAGISNAAPAGLNAGRDDVAGRIAGPSAVVPAD